MGDLTEHFSAWEFECECGVRGIKHHVVEEIQKVRSALGIRVDISSSFRCPFHNKESGGKETSSHLIGEALDLVCIGDRYRGKILPLLFKHFRRIGIGKTFIHVDNDPEKLKDIKDDALVIWVY